MKVDCKWYNITYNGITGYVRGDYVFEIKEAAADTDFETQLKASPASYHNALKALHTVYPNWSVPCRQCKFNA